MLRIYLPSSTDLKLYSDVPIVNFVDTWTFFTVFMSRHLGPNIWVLANGSKMIFQPLRHLLGPGFLGSVIWVWASCIKDFSYDECQASWMDESMANSLVIMFGAPKFDEIAVFCSIWTNCDRVSYQKFVVKWPTWQPSDSLLQKFIANQMSFLLLNSIFVQRTKKVKLWKSLPLDFHVLIRGSN